MVGGFAGTIHGAARLTVDLDVVYSRRSDNIERLASCLQELEPYLRGAPLGLPFRFDAATIQRGLNFTNLMAPAGPFLPWCDRAQGLARWLAERQPDLIGTREAMPESLEDFKVSFPNHDILGRGRRADGSGIQCAILYHREHFRVRDFHHFWISNKVDQPGAKLCEVLRKGDSDHWPVLADLDMGAC